MGVTQTSKYKKLRDEFLNRITEGMDSEEKKRLVNELQFYNFAVMFGGLHNFEKFLEESNKGEYL